MTTEATIKLPEDSEAWSIQNKEGFTIICVDPSKAEIYFGEERSIEIKKK